VNREQRLRAAIGSSVDRLVLASGSHDEQVMFEALGECLMWICLLDEHLWPQPNYENVRRHEPLPHMAARDLPHLAIFVGCRQAERAAIDLLRIAS